MSYIGKPPAEHFTSFATQTFSVSATTSYTLDHAVANENEIALFVNNVRQQPGSGKAYTATGTALTLSAATATTDTMYCIFLGRALQTVTPATNSITTSMININGGELFLDADADTSITADTDDEIHFKAGGNDLLKLTANGLHFPQSGDGIYLGVTSETAANLLDDYEEGTYTPTVTDPGGNVTISINSSYNTLSYTKIGRICYIAGSLVVSGISGSWSTHATQITVPFTAASLTDQAGKAFMNLAVYNTDLTNSGTYAYFAVAEDVAYGQINCARDNGTTGAGQVSSSAQLYFGGSYITA
tara:strand:+ start:967 stop:1872 length:906 start_codon:yes stop_codon:yes gene_type:complete